MALDLSFAFDATKGETAETLRRKRRLAEALLGNSIGRAPQNVGEGLNAIGQAIMVRQMLGQAERGEAAGNASAANVFSSALGSGIFPSAPSAPSKVAKALSPNPSTANVGSTIDFARGEAAGGDIAGLIRSTAADVGVDPVELATAISYETAGTFDPTKRGPTTQWGQHRGFIQFGEPQAKKYGVDWNDPVGSQLGPGRAVAQYLKDTGVKPGMGLLDIYSAINAGGVGRYNASDANNGGAPGTVADKVNKQMAGHRRKALALMGADPNAPAPSVPSTATAFAPAQDDNAAIAQLAAMTQRSNAPTSDLVNRMSPEQAAAIMQDGAMLAQPSRPLPAGVDPRSMLQNLGGQQVASLDPSIGMQPPAAPSPIPAPQQTAGLMIGTPEDRVRQSTPIAGQTMPMQPPAAGAQAVPMPQAPDMQQQPAMAPQQPAQAAPPIQVAQAGQQMAPQDEAAIFGQPVQPQQIAEMQVRRLFEVMAHPFASNQQRAIAASEIERLRQSSDPMAQLALRKAQLEVRAMENPTPEQFTLGEGQTRYDSQGNVIASGGQKNDAPTIQSFYDPEGREYKAQWNRQTSEWEPVGGAKLPSGMSLRSNPDGTIELIQGAGAGQKLTEGQGKDIGYYTRGMDADSALATLDTQLTDFVQENAGKVPLGVGNYLRDPKFRQAKQAADSFLTAILRKDTGAAITSQEFDIYGPMFLPVPGDDKATIEQKRRARQVALLAIRSGLGTAEAIGEANRIALGLPEQSIGPAASPPATAPAPAGGDPELDRLLEMYGD